MQETSKRVEEIKAANETSLPCFATIRGGKKEESDRHFGDFAARSRISLFIQM